MATEDPVLSNPRWLAVAEAVVLGKSVRAMVDTPEWRAMGLTRGAADHIKTRPEVRAWIERKSDEAIVRIARRVAAVGDAAVSTLTQLLGKNPDTGAFYPPDIRLRAARTILEFAGIKRRGVSMSERDVEQVEEVVEQVLAESSVDALEAMRERLRSAQSAANRR